MVSQSPLRTVFGGCHTIHEWTVADLKDAISQIEKEN